jgi:hypothetical protein
LFVHVVLFYCYVAFFLSFKLSQFDLLFRFFFTVSISWELWKEKWVSVCAFVLLGIHIFAMRWYCNKTKNNFIFYSITFLPQDVVLPKNQGSLGFSIIGGTDHSCTPFGAHEQGIFISHVSWTFYWKLDCKWFLKVRGGLEFCKTF